jgi:rhodanese-related sulfurtransferase
VTDVASLKQRFAGAEDVTVVDVRSRDEYAGTLGHIPDSLNIPLTELSGRLTELAPLKQRPLVLVCRTDMRSAKAAELLRAAGFAKVEVLRGGMTAWRIRG